MRSNESSEDYLETILIRRNLLSVPSTSLRSLDLKNQVSVLP